MEKMKDPTRHGHGLGYGVKSDWELQPGEVDAWSEVKQPGGYHPEREEERVREPADVPTAAGRDKSGESAGGDGGESVKIREGPDISAASSVAKPQAHQPAEEEAAWKVVKKGSMGEGGPGEEGEAMNAPSIMLELIQGTLFGGHSVGAGKEEGGQQQQQQQLQKPQEEEKEEVRKTDEQRRHADKEAGEGKHPAKGGMAETSTKEEPPGAHTEPDTVAAGRPEVPVERKEASEKHPPGHSVGAGKEAGGPPTLISKLQELVLGHSKSPSLASSPSLPSSAPSSSLFPADTSGHSDLSVGGNRTSDADAVACTGGHSESNDTSAAVHKIGRTTHTGQLRSTAGETGGEVAVGPEPAYGQGAGGGLPEAGGAERPLGGDVHGGQEGKRNEGGTLFGKIKQMVTGDEKLTGMERGLGGQPGTAADVDKRTGQK